LEILFGSGEEATKSSFMLFSRGIDPKDKIQEIPGFDQFDSNQLVPRVAAPGFDFSR
jgi:hypothetical protein